MYFLDARKQELCILLCLLLFDRYTVLRVRDKRSTLTLSTLPKSSTSSSRNNLLRMQILI